jgi:hypothetical protein
MQNIHRKNGASAMKSVVLNLPMFGFVVATRAVLGVGVGLLVAERLPRTQRRVLGRILVAIGALTTIPAARALRRTLRDTDDRATVGRKAGTSIVGHDEKLVGAGRFPRKGDDDQV